MSDLHFDAMVWDAHMDSLLRAMVEGHDLGGATPGHADLDRWRAGGIDVQVLALWVDPIYMPHHAIRRALQQLDYFHRLLAAWPERIGLARTAADVRRLRAEGRLAALLALEGGGIIENDLAALRTFHRLGVTSMTLTHSASIDWADSSTDSPRSGGLSLFGREVITEMNRLGMIVDVSHTSDDTVRAVLDVSSAPIIASHSACRALCDHPRNLSDDLLRRIAAAGGVVGINFYPAFLDTAARDAMQQGAGDLLKRLNEPLRVDADRLDDVAAERHRSFFTAGGLPPVPIDRLLDHIDHAVAVMGVDHVGLGSDFDGINATPVGLAGVQDFPRITDGLLARGYPPADVRKILGANFLRLLERVQATTAHAPAGV
jgi:membrane dipeptidase